MAPAPTLNVAHAKQYISTLDLSQPLKTVAVVGGSNGVGEGIVRTLGALGCKVIIMSRDEKNAKKIGEEIKVAKPRGDAAQVSFIKCDLQSVAGMKAAVDDLAKQVGPSGLDSIIMCQGGTPPGEIHLTSDGHEKAYAVQSLSRFVLTYRVVSSNALRNGATVVWVANSGVSLEDLSVDDLSLEKRSGKSKIGLFWNQSFRDATVLDSVNIELNERYPTYSFYNIHPGLVKTPTFDSNIFPFPFNWAVWFAIHTIATTPATFAPVPIYAALCSPEERSTMLKDQKTFGHKLQASKPGKWASTPTNRIALWEKLSESL